MSRHLSLIGQPRRDVWGRHSAMGALAGGVEFIDDRPGARNVVRERTTIVRGSARPRAVGPNGLVTGDGSGAEWDRIRPRERARGRTGHSTRPNVWRAGQARRRRPASARRRASAIGATLPSQVPAHPAVAVVARPDGDVVGHLGGAGDQRARFRRWKRVRARIDEFVAEPWREPFHLDEGSPDARTPIRLSSSAASAMASTGGRLRSGSWSRRPAPRRSCPARLVSSGIR